MAKKKGEAKNRYFIMGEPFLDFWLDMIDEDPHMSMEAFIENMEPVFNYMEGPPDPKTGKPKWRNVDAVKDGNVLTKNKVRQRMGALNKVISNEDKCPAYGGEGLPIPRSTRIQRPTIASIANDKTRRERIKKAVK